MDFGGMGAIPTGKELDGWLGTNFVRRKVKAEWGSGNLKTLIKPCLPNNVGI